MKSILLADNQSISSVGWRYLLQQYSATSSIKEVAVKDVLIQGLIASSDSLVILDYTLFDFGSVNELLILQERFPTVHWVLCSDELSADFVRTLLFNTQTFSVIMKDASLDELQSVLKQVIAGNRYICSYVSNILLNSSKKHTLEHSRQLLTITEKEILKEIALGRTTKEIAALRFISAHTVMTHRKNIFRKIEVNNVHEATKYAMRAGIVDMTEYYI